MKNFGFLKPQLIAGSNHTFGVDEGGTVYAWGSNSYGQLGLGNTANALSPVAVPALDQFFWDAELHIITGANHNFAVTEAGAVFAWGGNNVGQLGRGNTTNATSPVAITALNQFLWGGELHIITGQHHNFGVTEAGEVDAWGFNNMGGQLGRGDTTNATLPVAVPVLDQFFWDGELHIISSFSHNFGVTETGVVYAWGYNAYGQLGQGITDATSPMVVNALKHFFWDGELHIITGGYYNLGVTEAGVVFAWGVNYYGQLGREDTTNATLPVALPALDQFFWDGELHIVTGEDHNFGATETGAVYAWGYNARGQLGITSTASQASPVAVLALDQFFWGGELHIITGADHNFGITEAGRMMAWGDDRRGQLGRGGTSIPLFNTTLDQFIWGGEIPLKLRCEGFDDGTAMGY
jgi:alpha-tubulin suppressor-like RCC1 family protein